MNNMIQSYSLIKEFYKNIEFFISKMYLYKNYVIR